MQRAIITLCHLRAASRRPGRSPICRYPKILIRGSLPPRGRCQMIARGHFGLGELYGRKYGRTRHWRLSEVWGAEHTGACGL